MQTIKFGNISIDIIRKKVKHIYLRVYYNSGKIVLTAPKNIVDEAIIRFLESKTSWLSKKLCKLERLQKQIIKDKKVFQDGELQLFLGEKYKVKTYIVTSMPFVACQSGEMKLFIKQKTELQGRIKLVDNFYRSQLKKIIPNYILKWEMLMDVKVEEFRIKKMKTRWGSCNISAKRIWINLELAKYPIRCLEYIIVHEMVHLIEKSHNKRFYKFLEDFLPNWKKLKKELNSWVNGEITIDSVNQ